MSGGPAAEPTVPAAEAALPHDPRGRTARVSVPWRALTMGARCS
jgi:hypothetical protein